MNDPSTHDWQAIGDWKNGRVRSNAKALIWISLLFGLAFTGISLPGVLAIPEEISRGNHAVLLVLLFPLVGIAALTLFVHSVIAWRKFGKTELVLDPAPGSIGGDFGGHMDLRIKWDPVLRMSITLNCQRLKTTGSGKNRSTRTTVLWQREGLATLTPVPYGTRCEFRFDIPDELPQSEKASSDYHQWMLQLECDLPGVDFRRNFTVPVFRTALAQRSSLAIDYVKDSAPLANVPERVVHIAQNGGNLKFYYPWYRNLWAGIMTTVFGAVFLLTGYFAGNESENFLFPIIFGGVGAVCMAVGLYLLGNTLTATVSPEGIRIVRNIFGIRFQRQARQNQITSLQRRIASQTRTGSSTRVHYAIDAHTHDGRKITVADTLEGSRQADFIEGKIRSALWPNSEKNGDGLELVMD